MLYHFTFIKLTNFLKSENTCCWPDVMQQEFSLIADGIGRTTLEHNLAMSSKLEDVHCLTPSNLAPMSISQKNSVTCTQEEIKKH